MKADSTPTTLQNFSPMKQTAQFDDVAVLRTECDVNLQLWDTPGQEIYRSLVKIYYRNVQGVVLVVSLEEAPDTEKLKKQLASLEYWMKELSEASACTDEQMTFILIGNKSDATSNEKDCPCDKLLRQWCHN